MSRLRLGKVAQRFLSLLFLFVTGWLGIVGVDFGGVDAQLAERKFRANQPYKDFETIQPNFFCQKSSSDDKESTFLAQCTRMNSNYLKFYFSLFITIAWGGAVRTVIKTFELSIPYTVVLLITGLVLGLGSRINLEFCETWSMFTKFARTPPELILYIFLPILIFESAFSMKAHVFFSSFWSIVVVAFPGMVISTLFTALACMQFMENYRWNFYQAALFGAIISATDPVAVVAILRELGTSENLSIMVEGESLLNDGVAILLYEILKEIVESPDEEEEGQFLKFITTLVRIAIGGPAFGFVMGKVAVWCLTLIYNDAATEITITLVSAYLTYFVGEFYLHVSGVMAVVLLGVVINAESTCISPEVMHAVHVFWEMMSFLANTVLFVILGIVISETAINSFETRDLYNVVWLYVALNFIRLSMLFILSPILQRIGYETSWRNLTVMMWGGLRGAVGVCLALEVYRSKKLCMAQNIGPKFLLHTAGIVILTLIVNGTTTKALLDYLGVTTLSKGKLQDMANAVKNLTGARVRTIIALKHDRFLADANWEIVHRFTHLKDPYQKFQRQREEGTEDKVKKNNSTERMQKMHDAPSKINEKLITGGYLSSAFLKDGSKRDQRPSFDSKDKPVIQLRSEPSLLFIHQGKLKRGTQHLLPGSVDDMPVSEKVEDDNDSIDDADIDLNSSEFKNFMDECRHRVMKSMKISCWTQYEKGALNEEAVRIVVGAIEAKEEEFLEMIHIGDLRKYWEIKGVIPFLRNKLNNMLAEEKLPPKPKAKWRHPIYWLTTRDWFNGLIYFIIFINLAPIILEIILLARKLDPKQNTWEYNFLFISTITFTTIYALEFILKIIGRGWSDYFASNWNRLDFLVLIISLVELGFAVAAHTGAVAINGNTLVFFKNLRLVRFIRLLRWARPVLPMVNRIFQIRINARLFKGFDVGTGYVQAVEDALRFLPTMIPNKMVARKFRNILNNDRIETCKELLKLQIEHPGVVVAVKTRRAARAICGYMKEELETMKLEGLLEENEFDVLSSKIDKNLTKLWASPHSIKQVSPEKMVEGIPFGVGSEPMIEYFQESKVLKKYMPGDVIYNIGDDQDGIHLIISGIAKLSFEPTQGLVDTLLEHGIFPNTEFYLDLSFSVSTVDYLGVGSVVGEYGYLTKSKRASSVVCETEVETFHWPKIVMDQGMKMFKDTYDSLEARLWRSWGIKLASEFLHTTSQYSSWTGDKIRAHLEQGVVPVGDHFNSIELPEYIEEVVLIYGEISNDATTETAVAPALIPTTWGKFGVKPGSTIGAKVLIIAHDEELELLQESDSQTSLEKAILNAPGVALGLKDTASEGNVGKRKESKRRSGSRSRSIVLAQGYAVSRRRSLGENAVLAVKTTLKLKSNSKINIQDSSKK